AGLLALAESIVAVIAPIAAAAVGDRRARRLFDGRSGRHRAGAEAGPLRARGRSLEASHLVRGRGLGGGLFLRGGWILGRGRRGRGGRLLRLRRGGAGARPSRAGAVQNLLQFLAVQLRRFRLRHTVLVRNDVGLRALGQLLLVGRKLQVGK